MRWFKHMSDASTDEKLALFIHEHGMEGYGIFWRLLELIAAQMDGVSDKCMVQYPEKLLRSYLVVRRQKLSNLLITLQKHELLFHKWEGDKITLSCPNLLKFRDEYSVKKARNDAEMSGHTPETVRSDSDLSASASSQGRNVLFNGSGNPSPDPDSSLGQQSKNNKFDDAVKAANGGSR